TDLRMPGMDGGDFLARVRFERPNLPVIVMTGYTSLDPNDALWSKAGVLRVLYKPLNLREVSALLQQLFAS
ncbi:MAG: response regulator, partial [Alphaproteobacteria bacterium]|nr:response regulator [Alphaproteobacteria bacterium]